MRVVVFLSGGGGRLGVDGLFPQPAAARGPRILVERVILVVAGELVRVRIRPVVRVGADLDEGPFRRIGQVDRRLLDGLRRADESVDLVVGRIQELGLVLGQRDIRRRLGIQCADQRLHVSPLRRIGKRLLGQVQFCADADVLVDLVRVILFLPDRRRVVVLLPQVQRCRRAEVLVGLAGGAFRGVVVSGHPHLVARGHSLAAVRGAVLGNGHFPHQAHVLGQLDVLIRLHLVPDGVDAVVGEVRKTCGTVQHRGFGLDQRFLVAVFDLLPDVAVIGNQVVPIEAEQVKALLFVLADFDGGLLLAFRPDVILARRGGVLDVVRQVMLGRAACLRVLDRGLAVDGHQGALVVDLLELAVLDRVLRLLQRRAVDDHDPSRPVVGQVDVVQHQVILARVIDLDVGAAVGHQDAAVAGAQDLADQGDAARGRGEFLDDDRLLGRVEVAVEGDVDGAEVDALDRDAGQRLQVVQALGHALAALIEEADAGRRGEAGVDIQLQFAHPALQQTVDIQVPGGDADHALGDDSRFLLDADCQVGDLGQIVVGLRLGHAVGVEDLGLLDRQEEILLGVLDMLPAFDVQVEIAGGHDVHGPGPQFAGDLDATFGVANQQAAAFVDDAADQVQILSAGELGNGRVAQVVEGGRQCVLDDLDRVRAGRSRKVRLADVVQVHVARLEGRQHAVDGDHARRVANHGVLDAGVERALVEDVNLGAGPGDQLGAQQGRDRAGGRARRFDEDRARGGVQVR